MTDKTEEIKIDDTAREILQKIDEAWPSPIVLRKNIGKFSCGLVTEKTIAVLDGRGRGMIYTKINGKVAYTKQNVIDWLTSKICDEQKSQGNTKSKRRSKNDILLKK
jgi:hypothetical protein